MLLDEIAAYLVANGLGTVGSSIFLGSRAKIPVGVGPYISLTETGGTSPTRVHNLRTANTQRPTVQVLVRAQSYLIARTKAKAAYDVLDGVYETTLTGVRYHSITARQEPTDIGLDDQERAMISFNVEIEKQPS